MGILVEGLNFLVILFVTWVVSKIERRPNSVYGFGDEPEGQHNDGEHAAFGVGSSSTEDRLAHGVGRLLTLKEFGWGD